MLELNLNYYTHRNQILNKIKCKDKRLERFSDLSTRWARSRGGMSINVAEKQRKSFIIVLSSRRGTWIPSPLLFGPPFQWEKSTRKHFTKKIARKRRNFQKILYLKLFPLRIFDIFGVREFFCVMTDLLHSHTCAHPYCFGGRSRRGFEWRINSLTREEFADSTEKSACKCVYFSNTYFLIFLLEKEGRNLKRQKFL